MRSLFRRLRTLFRRGGLDRDLEEEMRIHLEMHAEENRESGVAAEEAGYAARRQFGNPTLLKETSREVWGWGAIERFGQDLRYALRVLRRSPGFTATAVAVVALGIGPTVAVFSVVDQVLLQQLPFPDAGRLYGITPLDKRGARPSRPKDFAVIRNGSPSFEVIGAVWNRSVVLSGVPEPQSLWAGLFSAGMFRVLGVPPILGRTFGEGEDTPGAEPVAVLGETLWRTSFQADPRIVGKSIVLDGEPYQVVGVMPARFHGPYVLMETDLWLPISQRGKSSEAVNLMNLYGRLRRGSDERQMHAQMGVLGARLGGGMQVQSLRDQNYAGWRTEVVLVFGFTALVLLIGCANLANLLLVRSEERARDTAVRAAIGAGPFRLMRQALAEALLIAFAGGAAGAVLAVVVLGPLATLGLPGKVAVTADLRLLGFALAVSLATAFLCALCPALRATRVDLNGAMKEGMRSGKGLISRRTRSLLIGAEVALSLTLSAGAVTLIHSFMLVRPSKLGFETRDRVVLSLLLGAEKYRDPAQQSAFLDRAVDSLASVNGVRDVAASSWLPWAGSVRGSARVLSESGKRARYRYESVSDRYFPVMGIPMIEGRSFERGDRVGGQAVVIVNEAFARRFFAGRSPIGQRVKLEIAFKNRECTIVGMAGTVRAEDGPPSYDPVIYLPFAQAPQSFLDLMVVTAAPPARLLPELKKALRVVDSDQPIRKAQLMSQAVVSTRLEGLSARTWLAAAAAGVALLLAAAGIFAVMSYAVTQRRHEIGVRMALGAQPRDVLGLVGRQAALYVVAGIVVGSGGAWVTMRLLVANLREVHPIGAGTLTLIAAGLALVAAVASLVPARRATKVDPMEALRHE